MKTRIKQVRTEKRRKMQIEKDHSLANSIAEIEGGYREAAPKPSLLSDREHISMALENCSYDIPEKSKAVALAAPDLLDLVRLEEAFDNFEAWAHEDVSAAITDNEGRDYNSPAGFFKFLRRAAIAKAEGGN